MESERRLTWIHTDRDFLAGLLRDQLESQGVFAQIKGETQSALTAGFGSSGMSQVFVDSEQIDLAKKVLEEFLAHKNQE